MTNDGTLSENRERLDPETVTSRRERAASGERIADSGQSAAPDVARGRGSAPRHLGAHPAALPPARHGRRGMSEMRCDSASKMETKLRDFDVGERYPSDVVSPEEEGDAVYSLVDNDCEPQSLEYMEDPYFIRLESGATPSLDPPDEEGGGEECWAALAPRSLDAELAALPGLELDAHQDAMLCIETEFIMDNRKARLRIFKKKMRDVRVHFQDLSKPYLVKISSQNNYKKFLGLGNGADEGIHVSPGVEAVPELAGMTPEEIETQKAEWSQELARVEDEIATLRVVLASKVRLSSELKRKLGISVWKEITDDVNQGIKNVKESQVYQKTESVIKSTAEKTSSILGGLTGGITSKLGQMRNSESFRSIEEKMGSAYENVKGKVSSRSNSVQSFDECLRDSSRVSPATSPTIPEEKLLQ